MNSTINTTTTTTTTTSSVGAVDERLVRSMAITQVFKDHEAPINGLDFSDDGELLVTSGDDDTIEVYSSAAGSKRRTVLSKKYGAELSTARPSSLPHAAVAGTTHSGISRSTTTHSSDTFEAIETAW